LKGDQNPPSNHKDNITQGNDETLHLHETYISDSALVESHPIVMEQERDTSWGDYPDDASKLSEDWDDYSSTQEDEIDCSLHFSVITCTPCPNIYHIPPHTLT
jgi:hypothetical protein